MKCLKCCDGVIRSIGYVIMQVNFCYKQDRKPEDYSFVGYGILGFEKMASPFCSGHILFWSKDFDECAKKLAEYRNEIENFSDDDPGTYVSDELPFP